MARIKRGLNRARRDEEQRVAAELITIANSLSDRVLEVTVPIFRPDTRQNPELVGSGVLIALADVRFLITAKHVLDFGKEDQLIAGVSPEFATIAGDVWRVSAKMALSDDDDFIDLGIVRVRGGPWDSLPISKFAAWEELDPNPPILSRHSFALIGFPISKNRKPLQGGNVKSFAYRMAGLECDSDSYQEAEHDPRVNLMVGFDRKQMWSPHALETSPDLNGASGSGLWHFGRKLRETRAEPRCSAILIECHKRRHKYLLGTRMNVVLHAIAERHPDVREFIEARTNQS